MYVQKGGVKFSVVNGSGKEAVVAMFGPSDFFGEGCMAGQAVRMGTTTAIIPTTLLVIEKSELLRVLHAEHKLSDHFIRYMLAHNIRVEEDLIDQLFISPVSRDLARTLLASIARQKARSAVRARRFHWRDEELIDQISSTRMLCASIYLMKWSDTYAPRGARAAVRFFSMTRSVVGIMV